jgi:arginyl-tRNA synthetase
VQYAHARICSIIRKAAGAEGDTDELTRQLDLDAADLSLLTDASELALMKEMSGFTDLIAAAARDRAAFRLTHYAQELAGLFHRFYTDCRVIGDDTELTRARLALCDAARKNLALTLSLLGVSAPERM